jgi:hypothetical protein
MHTMPKRKLRPLPIPGYVVRLDLAARAYAHLPMPARAVLRLCDGVRAIEAICAASPYEAPLTLRILERLVQLKLVAEIRRERRAGPRLGKRTPPVALHRTSSPIPEEPAETASEPPFLVTERAREAPKLALEEAFSPEEEAFFSRPIDHLIEDHFN